MSLNHALTACCLEPQQRVSSDADACRQEDVHRHGSECVAWRCTVPVSVSMPRRDYVVW